MQRVRDTASGGSDVLPQLRYGGSIDSSGQHSGTAVCRGWAKDDPAGTVRRGLGKKCARVLADAGVYKHDENGHAGFVRFLESIGYQEA